VIGVLFFILMSNIQVFTRLIPWVPVFPWTEELARYSFVWVMYLGVSWAMREKAHLRVDLVVSFFPKLGQKICGLFANLVPLVFSAYVGWYGINVLLRQIKIGQRLTASGLPMWVVTLCFPLSCALVVIRSGQRLYLDWTEKEIVLSEEEKAVRAAEAEAALNATKESER
jgi:TRAP-type C4-dicarboxylate transport system permease small subunit